MNTDENLNSGLSGLRSYLCVSVFICGSLFFLAGCATAPSQPPAADPIAICHEVFRRVDGTVAEAGVADGMAARVAGFPYLRVNRFLASYAEEELDDARFAEWMNRMMALGTEAWSIELANLPAERAEVLGHELWKLSTRVAWAGPALVECAGRVAAADLADPARRAEMKAAARVPDDYVTWHRVAGLYWLTRIPFSQGVARWHREVHATFAPPVDELPVAGSLRTYVPPPGGLSTAAAASALARASDNALGIPDPRGADLESLFRTYAPRLTVDTAGDADLPGEPGWAGGEAPRIVTRLPVVYRRVSHARYEGRVLLQLNYALWFPERPKGRGWDLLAGHLDAVVWRVTLAPDGAPWMFDTMHACGCYHLFFPTARAAARPQPGSLDETWFAPQRLPRLAAEDRLTVRLESATHYVQRVVSDATPGAGAAEYRFAEDDVLRSLPLPGGGRRSLFRPDGVVPGTERGERWFFWPMGVPEPGAMRQWGRHATAFVGRRHFDDARLMERYFALTD
jgi:hypothetical protein